MKIITHKFVEFIPEKLEENILYITIEYGTAVHKCFCGCNTKVVTPLSPTDWKLIFDGETVTLYPSIGNWSLPCRSHYWIENDRVVIAEKWSNKKIKTNRDWDKFKKQEYYDQVTDGNSKEKTMSKKEKINFWQKPKKRK